MAAKKKSSVSKRKTTKKKSAGSKRKTTKTKYSDLYQKRQEYLLSVRDHDSRLPDPEPDPELVDFVRVLWTRHGGDVSDAFLSDSPTPKQIAAVRNAYRLLGDRVRWGEDSALYEYVPLGDWLRDHDGLEDKKKERSRKPKAKLEDVDAYRKKHGMERLTREEFDAIEIGDFVKAGATVGGKGNPAAETMWFVVTGKGNGFLVTRLDNDPGWSDVHGLKLGDTVTLKPKHVFQVMRKPFWKRNPAPGKDKLVIEVRSILTFEGADLDAERILFQVAQTAESKKTWPVRRGPRGPGGGLSYPDALATDVQVVSHAKAFVHSGEEAMPAFEHYGEEARPLKRNGPRGEAALAAGVGGLAGGAVGGLAGVPMVGATAGSLYAAHRWAPKKSKKRTTMGALIGSVVLGPVVGSSIGAYVGSGKPDNGAYSGKKPKSNPAKRRLMGNKA